MTCEFVGRRPWDAAKRKGARDGSALTFHIVAVGRSSEPSKAHREKL
jgi:hypothetical protein